MAKFYEEHRQMEEEIRQLSEQWSASEEGRVAAAAQLEGLEGEHKRLRQEACQRDDALARQRQRAEAAEEQLAELQQQLAECRRQSDLASRPWWQRMFRE